MVLLSKSNRREREREGLTSMVSHRTIQVLNQTPHQPLSWRNKFWDLAEGIFQRGCMEQAAVSASHFMVGNK